MDAELNDLRSLARRPTLAGADDRMAARFYHDGRRSPPLILPAATRESAEIDLHCR
jgi:hypothetical protein